MADASGVLCHQGKDLRLPGILPATEQPVLYGGQACYRNGTLTLHTAGLLLQSRNKIVVCQRGLP